MKAEIHPKYEAITATCSCGNTVTTRSTSCKDFHIDVCSECTPASRRFLIRAVESIVSTSVLAVVEPKRRKDLSCCVRAA